MRTGICPFLGWDNGIYCTGTGTGIRDFRFGNCDLDQRYVGNWDLGQIWAGEWDLVPPPPPSQPSFGLVWSVNE